MSPRYLWGRIALCCALAATGMATTAGVVAATGGTASAATAVKSNGVWPLVGKVCGSGPGGSSSVRGVGNKSINIAVFNDASNTIDPGLEIEFLQAAKAFAGWCNASGGINGRKVVVQNRDAALFNAAQVTDEACQSDFMAVGGGMAFDAPSVPVRLSCGLGQISSYDVSNQAISAPLQVNPEGLNNALESAGWFTALAKAYPKAVKKGALGAQNDPGVINSYRKFEAAAEAQGWKFLIFQIPPISVADWTPYIQQLQTKGVEADYPSTDANVTPYVQAMNTSGYNPTFMLLGQQFYDTQTLDAAKTSKFPTTYVEIQNWPFQLASQSPGLVQMLALMHKYSPGASIDSYDDESFVAWVLWAKSATACGSHLTVSCVLSHAATQKNWSAGDIQAPVPQMAMSNDNPKPSACWVLMKVDGSKFVYDKTLTNPTSSIWNCNPKGLVKLPPSLANASAGA